MAFSSLSSYTQDIIMVQFEFFGKIFILGILFIASILIINFYKKRREEQIKKQESSPYLLVDLAIRWANYLSWLYIYFMPLYLLWLYPQNTLDGLLKGVITIYRLSFIIIGIILFANILLYGSLMIARLSGVRLNHKKADKVIDRWLGEHKNLFKQR